MKTFFIAITLASLSHTVWAADIHSTVLKAKGMTCASCPLTVKKLLLQQPGASEAIIDFRLQQAQVKFNPEKTQPQRLAKVITDIGYPTTVKK